MSPSYALDPNETKTRYFGLTTLYSRLCGNMDVERHFKDGIWTARKTNEAVLRQMRVERELIAA
ncbi:hypothetical protein SK128_017485, partial [Halocaridina rubra]